MDVDRVVTASATKMARLFVSGTKHTFDSPPKCSNLQYPPGKPSCINCSVCFLLMQISDLELNARDGGDGGMFQSDSDGSHFLHIHVLLW